MKTQQWIWAGAALLMVTACAQPARQDDAVPMPTSPPLTTDAQAPAPASEAEVRSRAPMAVSKAERLQSAAGVVADRMAYGRPMLMRPAGIEPRK